MKCYVYFLYSEKAGKSYVGISNNVENRLRRYNNGESISTRFGVPWKILY